MLSQPGPKVCNDKSFVLIGHESAGKSAIFRTLTNSRKSEEQNFRGSTVSAITGKLADGSASLVDTPGIRVKSDSVTTRIALDHMVDSDTVLLVAKATNLNHEVKSLLSELGPMLEGRRVALLITFADHAPTNIRPNINDMGDVLGIPVALIDARKMSASAIDDVNIAMKNAATFSYDSSAIDQLSIASAISPKATPFEYPVIGRCLSFITMFLLFGVPVWAAYELANYLQPIINQIAISRLVSLGKPLESVSPFLYALLVGEYGLLTLGSYSFLWAFPVVLFIGISVSLSDEIGLKDRITASLDPWLRRIGLSGRDLIPILTGFGCNVVAVFQSRACSQCSRSKCVSMISFTSACSYQIGASLSLFNAAGKPWYSFPYLMMLVVVGSIHNRLWYGGFSLQDSESLTDRSFIQKPTFSAVRWKTWAVVKKFLFTAMPIFLTLCCIASALHYLGFVSVLAKWFAPFLALFGLPADLAPGIVFSIIRKDGLLLLNQGGGHILSTISDLQLFLAVYLASTLTCCSVTLFTIVREIGKINALKIAAKQVVSSTVSALILVVAFRVIFA